MFLKLADKSFIKKNPDLNSYMPYLNNMRDSTILNDSANSILELCNGNHTIENIIQILKEKYNEDETIVRANVENFLEPLISCGLVEKLSIKTPSIITRGSSNIYYPDVISWEITDYCPLQCRHCYLPKKNNNILNKYDIDNIFKIIDSIGIVQVQLTGGEALTHPLLGYIIDQLINRGIVISISTSGMILNENVFNQIKKIKQIKSSFLRVSIDGNKNTHNYIRQNNDSYDNAIKFVKKAINENIPCQVGTTIIEQSKSEIEDLVRLSKNLGVSLIEIGMVCIQGNAKDNKIQQIVSTKDLNNFLKELSDKYSDNKFAVKVPGKMNQRNCGAGHKLIRIRPNLDVTPCPMLEFVMGNLKKQTIAQIMEVYGKVFHDFHSPNESICKDCSKKDDCKGCIAHGINTKKCVEKCFWSEAQKSALTPFLE